MGEGGCLVERNRHRWNQPEASCGFVCESEVERERSGSPTQSQADVTQEIHTSSYLPSGFGQTFLDIFLSLILSLKDFFIMDYIICTITLTSVHILIFPHTRPEHGPSCSSNRNGRNSAPMMKENFKPQPVHDDQLTYQPVASKTFQ